MKLVKIEKLKEYKLNREFFEPLPQDEFEAFVAYRNSNKTKTTDNWFYWTMTRNQAARLLELLPKMIEYFDGTHGLDKIMVG